jgi:cell division protein ZapA (FtsZ GTPase activity inhibitor)
MAAKNGSKPKLAVVQQTAALPGDLIDSAHVRAGNPFIGSTLVGTLLAVNTVLEFLANSARNRDVTANECVTAEGLANICDALHNALAHQAVALQTPGAMQPKA